MDLRPRGSEELGNLPKVIWDMAGPEWEPQVQHGTSSLPLEGEVQQGGILGSSRCTLALVEGELCVNGALGQLALGVQVVRSFPSFLENRSFKLVVSIFFLGNWKWLWAHSFSQPDLMVSTCWTSCTLKSTDAQSRPQRSLSSAFTELQGILVCIRVWELVDPNDSLWPFSLKQLTQASSPPPS